MATDMMETKASLLQVRPQHAFESSLLIASLISLPGPFRQGEERVRGLVAELVEHQQADGSWRGGPMLRVTRRDCFVPWRAGDPDRLFDDPNRLFTTAMVLDSLSRV
jgi:hypothetical protein